MSPEECREIVDIIKTVQFLYRLARIDSEAISNDYMLMDYWHLFTTKINRNIRPIFKFVSPLIVCFFVLFYIN